MRTRPRDSQRQRVYDAEKVLKGQGKTFETVAEMQGYVDALLAQRWINRHFQMETMLSRVLVTDGRGRRSGHAYSRSIAMPRFARYESYLLHEVAHILSGRCRDQGHIEHLPRHKVCYGGPSHGWHFAATLLKLVGHQMGKDAAADLKASFAEYKVRYKRPRKPMSPEQRRAAAERLAAARESLHKDT